MRFTEMNLSPELLRAIEDLGYNEATYIQKACIPSVLLKEDIIGQSQTGTGKTAAFSIPMIEMLQPSDKKKPKALILLPTRELALQVTSEIRKIAKYKEGLRTVTIYGGQPINRQIMELKKGADIVVGTPGRILDHIDRHTLRFDECGLLVLDEADEMLNMGFIEDIEKIILTLPEKRQTLLFSATMPKEILDIVNRFQNNPIHIKSPQVEKPAGTIHQLYYECNQSDKLLVLIQLLQLYNPALAMIFCNTKKMVDDLVAELIERSIPAAALHGDMKQEMRTLVMDRFKKRKITILVATDVAARGIDVDSMDIVFNYDLPQENEYYIHRIGRTGRAGKEGLAITLVTPHQRAKLKEIEQLANTQLIKQELPNRRDMRQFHLGYIKQKILDLLSQPVPEEMLYLMDEIIMEGYSAEEIAQALLYQQAGAELFTEVKKPRDPDTKKASNSAVSLLRLNIGKRNDIAAAHIVSAFAEASGISGKDIGKIEIKENETLVEVPQEFASEIKQSVQGILIHGHPVSCTLLGNERKNRKTGQAKPKESQKGRKASAKSASLSKKTNSKKARTKKNTVQYARRGSGRRR